MTDIEHLGRAIKQAQWSHHRALDSRLRALGSSLAQWDVLRAISNAPGASAHELALRTFQSDQAFGTLANRMLARHLLERRPGQGRRIEHHLTPAGEAILAAGHEAAHEVLGESFAGLSEHERAQLLELLERINRRGDSARARSRNGA